jgi:hypothetical protein
MSKLFSSILFSFFLLLHTTSIAEEETAPTQTNVKILEKQESEAVEEIEPTDEENDDQGIQEEVTEVAQEEVEPKEVLSEAQKEALAAEEAELRESGMEEEPVAE